MRALDHTHPRTRHPRPGLRVVSVGVIKEIFHLSEPLHELVDTQTQGFSSCSSNPTQSNLPITQHPEGHGLVRRETRGTQTAHLFTYGLVVHPVHEEGYRVVHEPVVVVRQPLVVGFWDWV